MIKFSAVSKNFGKDSFGVKNISFDVAPGELILITGPSGSGKTTLMKLLTKEYEPTTGEIKFHDSLLKEIKRSRIHEHRRQIGVVFQDYKLIPELNVWENIALPLSIIGKNDKEIEERVTDLLILVSLTNKAHLFPKQLSGGEAQRISIARALSTGPKVIFADEPTGNLDRETSLEISKLIRKINSYGTTVLFSTHDHDVMKDMTNDRHIVLENGELKYDSAKKKKVEVKKEEKPDKAEVKTKIEIKKIEKKPGFFQSLFGKKTKKDLKPETKEDVKEDKTKKEVSKKKIEVKKEKPTAKTKKTTKKTVTTKKDTKEKE